jgi:type IV pilus assembly protein PilM
MARAVGLDIGSHTIKVVELTGSPKAFRIQRVAVREIPQPPSPEQGGQPEGAEPYDRAQVTARAVREVFSSLKLPAEDVCASFDSGTTISREITVPFFEPEKIRKVVKFEAEHHLHSQSVDEVVVNWIKTGETKEGSRLTIFASSKEELVQHLAVMRLAGVEPATIDMDATALFTCADALGLVAKNPNAILLNVGARVTQLLLLVDGKPRMLRSFLLGVAHLPPALPGGGHGGGVGRADDLLVPAAEVAARTAVKGQTELAPAGAQIEFVKKLHREVIRSLASVRQDAPPTVVYLSGGGSLVTDVKEALQERFGLPVERLNVFDHAPCRDPGVDPAYVGSSIPGAVGCALRLLGHNPLGTELLQDEFAPSNTFEVLRTAAATAVTLLFLVLLGLNYKATREHDAARALNTRIYNAAGKMFANAERAYLMKVDAKDEGSADKAVAAWLKGQPPDHTRIGNLRRHLVNRHRKLQSDLGMAKEIPEVPSATRVMFELWRALSAVPRDELGEHFAIVKLDVSERRCTFTIEATAPEVFDQVRALVTKNDYLRGRAKDKQRVLEAQSRQKTNEGHESQGFEIKFEEQD